MEKEFSPKAFAYFAALSNKFQKRCVEIRKKLIRLNPDFSKVYDFFSFSAMDGGIVFAEFGNPTDSSFGRVSFPAKLIMFTDDEIEAYIDDELLKKEGKSVSLLDLANNKILEAHKLERKAITDICEM